MMHSITGVVRRVGIITALAVSLGSVAHAQSGDPFQVTRVAANVEGAIRLDWQSETNTYYLIEYADQLNGNPDGTTAWSTLYDDYPSHGTNTFWLDTGYYVAVPPVPHPKYSQMRFYRVSIQGTDTAPAPNVAITAPANGAVATGQLTVTVAASSAQPVLQTLLYVDGQEMPQSDDGTNYVINTCEWPNGPHVLFAVAKSQSGFAGLMNDGSITYGRAVSAYVNVNFSNLISQFAFSQAFFEPSLGQTQQVTASFAANVNWTLQIQDVNSNTVRTVTGNGASMLFNWDGTGDGGASIPDGVYTYLLNVQTNGQNMLMAQDNSLSLALANSTQEGWYPTTAKQAIAAGWDCYYVQPPPMPPIRTNGVWVNWEDVYGPHPLIKVQVPDSARALSSTTSASIFGATTDGSPSPQGAGYGGPAGQGTRAPTRPPAQPIKGSVGIFGIAYQTYTPNGVVDHPPRTGWVYPLPVYVAIDGLSANAMPYGGPVRPHKDAAENFSKAMQKGGWKPAFTWVDSTVTSQKLKKSSLGGDSIFNNVNLGLLMTHGSYATTAEKDNIKYTYVDLDNGHGGVDWLRLSDMDFGGGYPVSLRWMTIAACNLFHPSNMSSMGNGRLPINQDLHLLLGASTIYYANQIVGKFYAENMLANQTIPNAWINASKKAYSYATSTTVPDTINVRIYGWQDCFNDTLSTYYASGDSLIFRDVNVYTPQ